MPAASSLFINSGQRQVTRQREKIAGEAVVRSVDGFGGTRKQTRLGKLDRAGQSGSRLGLLNTTLQTV